MFGLFSSKQKSTGSSNKANEIDVTFHRKRKRETIQAGYFIFYLFRKEKFSCFFYLIISEFHILVISQSL